jgi:hypothetical protein
MMAKSSCTSEFVIEVIIVQVKHFHLKLFKKKLTSFFVAQTKLIGTCQNTYLWPNCHWGEFNLCVELE